MKIDYKAMMNTSILTIDIDLGYNNENEISLICFVVSYLYSSYDNKLSSPLLF